MRIDFALQVQQHLAQSEQIKVADHEGGKQDDEPAEPERGKQSDMARAILYIPDNSDNRPPLPENEEQEKAGQQNIGAALEAGRNDFGPGFLEPRPGHD